MRTPVDIGLLYSQGGSYGQMSRACRDGALAAIADVNADPGSRLTLTPVEADPKGNLDLYEPLCARILAESAARHVVGCITSSSRKEVIPALERGRGVLWYACPHEGFETSDRVVYTHACPNQHLLPLLHWAVPRFGRRAFLTGSNYIWGWEMNRVARETLTAQGGAVLGERYLAVGDTGIARLVAEIAALRPDFVLNNLIGDSSHAFLAAMAELRQADPAFAGDACPVLSCNLTECELPVLGRAAEGLIAVGPHFAGERGWRAATDSGADSSYEAAAYGAVRMLARLIEETGPDADLATLLASPAARDFGLDAETHHMRLPVLIARVTNGRFEVIERAGQVVADPYLTRRERWPAAPRPALRAVP
ncbi:transporter substrate-binding protein [Oceaniglobus roseus]|uniref:transporter substrate-binding protein n=1 Tax=Oceaniglobus roseus TaxID=1737570 RepID=UPI000C7F11A0|nr:transporter substrate-binding protein [Kandeliimicrobium roseum]